MIGGNAVIGYGSQRLTVDYDCAIVAEDDPARDLKDWQDIRFLLDRAPRDWSAEELRQIAESQASEEYRERLRRDGYL